MADQAVLQTLRRLPLFSRLSAEQLDQVAAIIEPARHVAGQRLYQQGQISPCMFIFMTGGARMLQTVNGKEYPFSGSAGDVRPGEAVGEECLFFDEPRNHSLLMVQDSYILVIRQQVFKALLSVRPDIQQVLNPRADILQRLGSLQAQSGVRSDERLLMRTRRHPWVLISQSLRGFVLCVLIIVLLLLLWQKGILTQPLLWLMVITAVTLPAFLMIYYLLEWIEDFFTITDQRVIHDEKHVLTMKQYRDQALLYNIQNVQTRRRGLLGELLGIGDVIVSTAGSQAPLVMDRVAHPLNIQQLIFTQMQEQRTRPPVAPPPASMPSPTPVEGTFTGIYRELLPRTRTEDGDSIIYRRHWVVLFGKLLRPTLTFIIVLIGIMLLMTGRWEFMTGVPRSAVLGISSILMLIILVWWYWVYVDWRDDLYIVDRQFLYDIKRRPLWLQETRIQTGLRQVQNVSSYINGPWERLFNVGDVMIQTAAEQGLLVFKSIGNPQGVAEEILQRVQFANQRTPTTPLN